jgi:autotransporter-associated beta strand protein
MFWNANSIAAAGGVSGIGSPIDIEGGRLVLTASAIELGTQRITNNAILEYAAPASSQTLSGPIDGTGLLKVSNGTLTLSSTSSDFSGNIVLTNGGVLVAGGAQTAGGTGPLGTNGTILFNGGTLQFSAANTFDYSPRFSTAANQAYSFNTGGQNVAFTNALTSSGGTLTKLGSGTLALTGANTYTGATTVSNGTLVVSSVGGDLNVNGGTLAAASASAVGTLGVSNNLTISSGTVLAILNKALSPQSNSVYSVNNVINYTGGTLKVVNAGPDLAIGDKFILFSQPVPGGAAMPIVSTGVTFENNLAVDGSITFTGTLPQPTVSATVSGGQLVMSWPAGWTGLHLQSQTNTLANGLGTNWVTIPETDTNNSYSTTPNNSNGSVFFRLVP